MNLKSVIVSGGASGIGLACVKLFLENNWQVFNLDIQEPTLKHDQMHWFKCDLTNTEEVIHTIQSISVKTSTIDCLITSAGKHFSATIEQTTDDQFYDVINTNIKSAFILIRESLPLIKPSTLGSIITIGSDQSLIAKRNSAVYGLSKAAIAQLTKNIALDYAKYNITANCIAAGTIDTPLYQNAIKAYSLKSGESLESINKDEASTQPLNRIGKPEEVAALAYFLASNQASFITGSVISVDGGYTAQ
ncbi:SDR family oxidoreductase [Thiotrichales bacterium 19S11-10]|nr:SDR family oxidoreductase [Thiotrichales bacterium 19S11-10]